MACESNGQDGDLTQTPQAYHGTPYNCLDLYSDLSRLNQGRYHDVRSGYWRSLACLLTGVLRLSTSILGCGSTCSGSTTSWWPASVSPGWSFISLSRPGSTRGSRELREQFQPLAPHCPFQMDKAGNIPSGARQAGNEAGADRVGNVTKYDRDRPRLPLERSGYRRRA